MGPEVGIKLVDRKDDVEALIIYEQDEEFHYVFSHNFDKYNFTLLDSTALFDKDLQ